MTLKPTLILPEIIQGNISGVPRLVGGRAPRGFANKKGKNAALGLLWSEDPASKLLPAQTPAQPQVAPLALWPVSVRTVPEGGLVSLGPVAFLQGGEHRQGLGDQGTSEGPLNTVTAWQSSHCES